MAEQKWRAKLEPRADQDGSFSLVACSTETECTIMCGLLKSEADEIARDVNAIIEAQLAEATDYHGRVFRTGPARVLRWPKQA